MAPDDKYKKKTGIAEQDEESGGETGAGGKGGQVEFRDFLAAGESFRDDLLPPEEKRRLLAVHGSDHERRVNEQKQKRDQLKAVKDHKIPLQVYRQSMGAGMNERYKLHFLTHTVQFGSGITDTNVNSVPNENNAETNNEKRKELQLNYDLVNRPEMASQPKFIPPKPTPYK